LVQFASPELLTNVSRVSAIMFGKLFVYTTSDTETNHEAVN
jgi:hypothetical protein